MGGADVGCMLYTLIPALKAVAAASRSEPAQATKLACRTSAGPSLWRTFSGNDKSASAVVHAQTDGATVGE